MFATAQSFNAALLREISYAKREKIPTGVIKFELPESATFDEFMYFANELELAIRQHDLIGRVAVREFAVLIRTSFDISEACEALVARLKIVERRPFIHKVAITDGTKGVAEILAELDNS